MKKQRIIRIICVIGTVLVIMIIGIVCWVIGESNRGNYYKGMILDTDSEDILWSENVKLLAAEIQEEQSKPLVMGLLDSAPKDISKKVFDTWDDLIDFLGFTPWNPLEGEGWVERKPNQCYFDCDVSENGSISSVIIKTGYSFNETVDVIQTTYLVYHPSPTFDMSRTKKTTVEIKTRDDGADDQYDSHLVARLDTTGYSLELAISKDNKVFSTINLSNKTEKDAVINAYSKLCERLGIEEVTNLVFYNGSSLWVE